MIDLKRATEVANNFVGEGCRLFSVFKYRNKYVFNYSSLNPNAYGNRGFFSVDGETEEVTLVRSKDIFKDFEEYERSRRKSISLINEGGE